MTNEALVKELDHSQVEAWFRRNFCNCCDWHDTRVSRNAKLGDVLCQLTTQPIQYIWVGRGRAWIKTIENVKV